VAADADGATAAGSVFGAALTRVAHQIPTIKNSAAPSAGSHIGVFGSSG
jgi:hypothetical protein